MCDGLSHLIEACLGGWGILNNERAALLTVIVAIALLITRGPLLHRLSAFSSWYATRLDSLPLLAKGVNVTGGIVALLYYQLGDHHTVRSGSSTPPSLRHPRARTGGDATLGPVPPARRGALPRMSPDHPRPHAPRRSPQRKKLSVKISH